MSWQRSKIQSTLSGAWSRLNTQVTWATTGFLTLQERASCLPVRRAVSWQPPPATSVGSAGALGLRTHWSQRAPSQQRSMAGILGHSPCLPARDSPARGLCSGAPHWVGQGPFGSALLVPEASPLPLLPPTFLFTAACSAAPLRLSLPDTVPRPHPSQVSPSPALPVSCLFGNSHSDGCGMISPFAFP